MRIRLAATVLFLTVSVAPATARADWGVRAAYLVPMYVNTGTSTGSSGSNHTYGVGDAWLSNLDLILSWYPISFLSIDLEGQFNLSSTNPTYPMTGIYVGPGITLDFPFFLYARASLPVQVTPNSAIWDLRLAGGLKLQIFVVYLYIEGVLDVPLAGGPTSTFGSQAISVAAGLWVKF